ncbi:MAG TPA: hypothetical protein VJM11_05470 [Nevskiaceae bacterium]|nr:hypothetical protein [Nevskiaceae bacterium]
MSGVSPDPNAGLVGTPSDDVPAIGAEGDGAITTLFVSMAKRHPTGADADYLRWHSLDHRPEQHRLAGVRASLRVVSTPACRAARAASHGPFDAVDHVMTYCFADRAGLDGFGRLSRALSGAGRVPFVLEPVQRGVYTVTSKVAAPHAKAGAAVLPWRPVRGVYLVIEPAGATSTPLARLAGVAGVAGLWSGEAVATPYSSAEAGQRLTCGFLEDDPVAVALRIKHVLDDLPRALLAAPFQAVVPFEWDRYLP